MARNRAAQVAAATLVIALVLLTSRIFASRAFDDLVQRYHTTLGPVRTVRANIVEVSDTPRTAISPIQARDFIATLSRHRGDVDQVLRDIKAGHGLLFWHWFDRQDLETRATTEATVDTQLSDSLQQGLAAIASTVRDGDARLEASAAARTDVVRVLAPESDHEQFRASIAALSQQVTANDAFHKGLGRSASAAVTPLGPALLAGLANDIAADVVVLSNVRSAVTTADHALADAERTLVELLDEDGAKLEAVASTSGGLLRVAQVASIVTEPLRGVLERLDQPAPGGELLGLFASGLQRSSGDTYLDVLEAAVPTAGAVVSTVNDICKTVEDIRSRSQRVSEAAAPAAAAVRTFRAQSSRQAMRGLSASSTAAAEAIQRETTLFDPAIHMADSARSAIRSFGSAGSNSSVALVRQLVDNITSALVDAADGVKGLFQSGKTIIVGAAELLKRVQAIEEVYQGRLGQLSAQVSGPSELVGGV